ncbi:hypothetical protein Tco_0634825 [Tanacetum coccineum]
MLGPSGGGLILYQAYGNLYAMTGRKAYLLEDKQISSVGVFDEVYLAFGRHLEEIYVTWAHLEKKRTRLRTNTKTLEDLCSQSLKTASPTLHNAVTTHLVTTSQHFMTASARTGTHADLEDSTHDGQMMKGSDIGIQEKKAKLFNEWERFTSTDGESIESYYHRFLKLMNDFKRNKHFPEKISNPTTAINMALVLMAKAFKLNYSTPTNNNQRISSNPRNRHIAQPGMNMGQDRQMQMVGGNGGNQFRQSTGQNIGNQNGYNNGLIVVPGIANQNPNRNGNVVAARAEGNANGNNGIQLQAKEFDLMAAVADLDKIEEVNANCILMANLQQALTSSTQTDKAPIYDSDGSAELLEPIPEPHQVQQNNSNVSSEVSGVEQEGGIVEQHPATVEETQRFENCIIKNENEYAKLWNDWFKKCEECKYDKILYDKAYNDMQQKIERLQAQLGDHKGKSKDTSCVSGTLDPLPQKLENENVELEFQVRNYEKENDDLKTVYKNLFDSINVTRAQTKTIIDSVQTILHDTIYEKAKLRAQLFDKVSEPKDTTKVIVPGMFMINPFKNSREENSMPNKPIKASFRTNPITILQPHVITKKFVNSDSNVFFSTRVDITTKTRIPQLRSNTKNDRVPSASKSSRIKNKGVEVEEHPKNLLLSKNKKNMSSECNNVKLAIQNDKSKIVCVMCKQCLITANHDACVLNYVNGMNSHGKKQKENVSNIANQMKHKPHVKKPKKVGSKERLASSKPSKPRMCLRWLPTRRIFDLCGKIIESSDSECYLNMFMVHRLGLFQAYDRESKASHPFLLEVFRNRSLWK